MSTLAEQLDAFLRAPLPQGLDAHQAALLHNALQIGVSSVRPYSGDFQAPWLLTSFDASVWHTTNRGREEFVDGVWQNTVPINWSQPFPDGSHLTDQRYTLLLKTLRTIAWLSRAGLLGWSHVAVTTWQKQVFWTIRLAAWLVLHADRYRPEKHGLRLMDQAALNTLAMQLAAGGWFEALQAPTRLLMKWYPARFGSSCPPSLLTAAYAVPTGVCEAIVEALETDERYYLRSRESGPRYLNRAALAEDLNAPLSIFHTKRTASFLRQFEPDLWTSKLLVPVNLRTEYPSQRTLTRADAARLPCSEGTLDDAELNLLACLSARRHVPDLLPDPTPLHVKEAIIVAKLYTKESHHTPFLPIDTGLAYLREAVRWVHVYGDAIVSLVVAMSRRAEDLRAARASKGQFLQGMRKALAVELKKSSITLNGRAVPLTEALPIHGHDVRQGSFARMRERPSLAEALDVLVGACIVCMAILKPSRRSELHHIPRECLVEGADGFYLRFELGKSNVGEAYQLRDKPIPYISAQAVKLLQRLGTGLVNVFDEKRKIRERLFYLPDSSGFRKPDRCSLHRLRDALFAFCDFVALPPDELGRRWYVRIHEMRKWFLLLLFWSGRFDVLDAVRWIAGHTDVGHTWAYLEANFPGEELPALEAEYAVDRIRRLEEGLRPGDGELGLQTLYEKVCEHFAVGSLAMVPEGEWAAYVAALRSSEAFHLEPHTIYGHGDREVVGLCVSFKLSEPV